MIGLMFFGVIALWVVVAIVLGQKIPQWLKLKPAWGFVFVPLVFFAPVIDEVIALPQAYALCKQAEEAFWYDPTARSKVISNGLDVPEKVQIRLGPTTSAQRTTYAINLIGSDQAVIKWTIINFSSGFLHVPAGSSGTSMPLLLPEECPSRLISWPKIDAIKQELNLTLESK